MKTAWIVLLVLGSVRSASAQIAPVVLLRLDQTPATQSLGKAAAFLTGAHAVGVNPAGILTDRYEAFAQHQAGLANTTLQSFRGVVPVPAIRSALAVSYLKLDSSGFEARNAQGLKTGTFKQSESLLGVHASHSIPLDRLSARGSGALQLGVGVKRMASSIAGRSAVTQALDLGAAYRGKKLSLGFSALNLGNGLRFVSEKSELPREFVASAAYQLTAPLTLLASLSRSSLERTTDVTVGMQYWFLDAIAVRARYTGGDVRAGALGGVAAGLALKVLGSTLDYAFRPAPDSLRAAGVIGAHQMGITVRFGSPGTADSDADVGSVFRTGTAFSTPYREYGRDPKKPQRAPRSIVTENTRVSW